MSMRKLLFPALLPLFVAAIGCASSDGTPGGTGGSSTSTGGRSNTGSGGSFTSGSGGTDTSGSGGSVTSGSGGTTGSGGAPIGTGGVTTGSGGSVGSGGTIGSGGRGTGGATVGTGGATTGSGGSTGTGGATHTGPCDVWVAPDGLDTNPGTQAMPVLTPQHAYDLICPPTVGSVNGAICAGTLSTMCLKAGTYKLATRIEFKKTRMGTPTRIITMMADPAATTKPILDFSGQPRLTCGAKPADKNIYGVDMGADWYRVKGLEVTGANDTGILVQGAHDFVELCDVHDSGDTGIKISSASGFTGSGTYNTVLNSESHHNNDPQCNGANADGFGAKEGTGVGNVFDGCRAWDNADDGWDFYGWTSPVTVKNSWAFNMGGTTAGTQSNGNGFKMGGNKVPAAHTMSNLFAFDNNGNGGHKADWGFTNNSNPTPMTCAGCGARNNMGGDFQVIMHTGDVAISNVTTAKAIAAKRNPDGSLPDITKL